MYERGATQSRSTSEFTVTDQGFSGIGTRDDLLRHEINLLFFPAQPLVTKSLIEKIKSELSEG